MADQPAVPPVPLVAPPPPKLLSVEQFLQMPLAPLLVSPRPYGSATQSATRRRPARVDVWENFAAEVLSFRLNDTVGVYRVPQTVASNNRGLNNEAMVQTAFYHNAISPLFLLPTPQGKAVQFSIPGGTEGTHDMTVSLV
jgi:hypothetical protein